MTLVDAHHDELGVKPACDALGVSRATWYRRRAPAEAMTGMLVMTGKGAGDAFVRSIRSLDWAFRQLMHDRGTTLALSIGLITAMASGLLVISLPLLGLPFLFVVVGLAFRGYRQPERL
jgi:hypothetical protein